jgi:hypothetical protein
VRRLAGPDAEGSSAITRKSSAASGSLDVTRGSRFPVFSTVPAPLTANNS